MREAIQVKIRWLVKTESNLNFILKNSIGWRPNKVILENQGYRCSS